MMRAGDIRELVSAAFGAAAHPLAAWYAGLMEDAPPLQAFTAANATRLAALLCGKLDQLVAGTANLLVLVSDDGLFSGEHVDTTLQELRRRAEANDDAYFAFRGLAGARALRQVLSRLSGMLMVVPTVPTEALFVHQQARHPLPAALARAAPTWGLAARIGPLPDGQPPEG